MSKKQEKPPLYFETHIETYPMFNHQKIAENLLYNSPKNPFKSHDNEKIDEVFYIIYKNAQNPNQNIFKQYLCDILDRKHIYHIFNTNFYLDTANFQKMVPSFIPVPNEIYITFFTLMAFYMYIRDLWIPDILYNLINTNIYLPKIQEITTKKKQVVPDEVNFKKDFGIIINIFENIFENNNKILYSNT